MFFLTLQAIYVIVGSTEILKKNLKLSRILFYPFTLWYDHLSLNERKFFKINWKYENYINGALYLIKKL